MQLRLVRGYWAIETLSTEAETGVMEIFGCQDLIYGCRYLHFQLKLLESKWYMSFFFPFQVRKL